MRGHHLRHDLRQRPMAGRVPCRRRHHLPTLFRHQVGPVADAAFLSFDDVADSLTLHPESPGDVDLSRPALMQADDFGVAFGQGRGHGAARPGPAQHAGAVETGQVTASCRHRFVLRRGTAPTIRNPVPRGEGRGPGHVTRRSSRKKHRRVEQSGKLCCAHSKVIRGLDLPMAHTARYALA